jgi:aconitate hydratase
MRAQGLFHTVETPEADYTDVLTLDLGAIEPSMAGPKRPQDRVRLTDIKANWAKEFPGLKDAALKAKPKLKMAGAPQVATNKVAGGIEVEHEGQKMVVGDGAVVIASITSCTNTSNPSVLIAAGLVAKKAVELGLTSKPWVKTSLAPGSQVVTDYLTAAGLVPALEALKFHVVGYGCATCIGNSGPLPDAVSAAIDAGQLVAVSVLSGNRNFEGRVHAEVRANYLASPPLCVAYALAGRIDLDLTTEAIGTAKDGKAVYLKDIWPTTDEVKSAMNAAVKSEMFVKRYSDVFGGGDRWKALTVKTGATYEWDTSSTYVQHPPYFVGMSMDPKPVTDIGNARVLALFGDSITTDHISPAGNIKADSPAGKYLQSLGVEAGRLQQLRRAPRKSRGDDARHLREHAHQEQDAERRRGWLHDVPADGTSMAIFDAAREVHGRRNAARDPRRQGVRLGLVARLGGEGPGAAGRARRASPRASSASTARTSSAWASCPSSSGPERQPPRWD